MKIKFNSIDEWRKFASECITNNRTEPFDPNFNRTLLTEDAEWECMRSRKCAIWTKHDLWYGDSWHTNTLENSIEIDVRCNR